MSKTMKEERKVMRLAASEYANSCWDVTHQPNEHDNCREDFIAGYEAATQQTASLQQEVKKLKISEVFIRGKLTSCQELYNKMTLQRNALVSEKRSLQQRVKELEEGLRDLIRRGEAANKTRSRELPSDYEHEETALTVAISESTYWMKWIEALLSKEQNEEGREG